MSGTSAAAVAAAVDDYDYNPLALAGCFAPNTAWNWNTFFWIHGIIWCFYGVVLFMSPFKLVPTEGMMKYGWMAYHAGIKADSEDRGEYDHWAGPQSHFIGISFLTIGLFNIWATDSRDDFSFFTVLVITSVLQFATFLYVLKKDFEKWNAKVYGWGAAFLAIMVVSCLILGDQDTDAKQFNSDEGDLDAGPFLWFLGAFLVFGGVQLIGTSFEATKAFGAEFYMTEDGKTDFSMNGFNTPIQRFAGCCNIGMGLICLWGAAFYDSDNQGDPDWEFPSVMFYINLLFLLFGVTSFVMQEGYYEEFAIYQFATFLSALTVSALCGTASQCW